MKRGTAKLLAHIQDTHLGVAQGTDGSVVLLRPAEASVSGREFRRRMERLRRQAAAKAARKAKP